jgi:proteasome component ECM29
VADCCPNRAEVISATATEALFASVNPSVAQGKELQEALTRVLDAVAAMQNRSSGLRRVLYPGIAQLFARMEKSGDVPRFETGNLKRLLFGSDIEVEAVRLLRAEAIVAVTKASPWLAAEVRSDIQALRDAEASATVLARLPG